MVTVSVEAAETAQTLIREAQERIEMKVAGSDKTVATATV